MRGVPIADRVTLMSSEPLSGDAKVGNRIVLEGRAAVVTQVKPHAIEIAFMGGGRRWIKTEQINRLNQAGR